MNNNSSSKEEEGEIIAVEKEYGIFHCGKCDEKILFEFKYCPYCRTEIGWLLSVVMRNEYI